VPSKVLIGGTKSLYSRRKKGVVEGIFERIQKFKKFKESLEPYFQKKVQKNAGELVVNWDVTLEVIKMENEDMESNTRKYPLGAKIVDYTSRFKGPPVLSDCNPLVR
jgi:hypothetical protein